MLFRSGLVSEDWRISVQPSVASVGGGTLADSEIPSWSVTIGHSRLSSEALAGLLRGGTPCIFGRVWHEKVWLDLRSLPPAEDQLLVEGLRRLWEMNAGSDPRTAEV